MKPTEVAYRKLSSFLNTHHTGTPTREELEELLNAADRMRADLTTAILEARNVLADTPIEGVLRALKIGERSP